MEGQNVSRAQAQPEQSYSDEDQAVLDILRMAMFDPGQFCERQYTDHGDVGWPTGKEYEPLHAWQARAALAALTRHEVV